MKEGTLSIQERSPGMIQRTWLPTGISTPKSFN